MKICAGCGKEYEKGVSIGVNDRYFTPTFEVCCPTCVKQFKSTLDRVQKKSYENISRNPNLSERFDKVAFEESTSESLNWSGRNQSFDLRAHMYYLLEEIHQFIYQASFECALAADLTQKNNPEFFTERYFLYNAVLKTVAAWERLIRYYSLYFAVQFRKNKKWNSLRNLQNALRKTDFKNTKVYEDLKKQKSIGSFTTLESARKSNDHGTSYHLGRTVKDHIEMMEIILANTEILYSALEEALDLFQKQCRLADKSIQSLSIQDPATVSVKLIKKRAAKFKRKFDIEKILQFQEQSIDYIAWVDKRLRYTLLRKTQITSPPLLVVYYKLFDCVIRLHESARSLGYAAELFSNASYLRYQDADEYWIGDFAGMNYRYFIINSLIRVYATYDKLAVIIQDLFEVQPKRKSFEGTVEFIRANEKALADLPPLKKCEHILSHNVFKKLYSHRQDFSHLLIKQNFMIPAFKEVLDAELMLLVIENSKLIYDLIESLDVALVGFHVMEQNI